MSKIFKSLIPVAAVAMTLLAACDDIPLDERLIYVKPAAVARAVLIEDFTGQRCVNCPNATATIEQLIHEYGDSAVIAVGIHCGPFGKSTPLLTAEGDEYYNHWKVAEQPSGMVNRLSVSAYTTWGAQVYKQIQLNAPVSIRLSTELDPDSRQLKVNTALMAVDGNVNAKLQLWLTEDSIVSAQFMPDGTADRNYIHNHVFRQSINGTWGEDIAVDEGLTTQKNATVTLSDSYSLNHLSVVAFVYNDSGVLQATKTKITQP